MAVEIAQLVMVGYLLAGLSYYIGAILLASPAPIGIHRFRHAGREMMMDGMIAVVLITSLGGFTMIIGFVTGFLYGGLSLDAAYSNFYVWITGNIDYAWRFLAMIAIITWLIGLADQAIGMVIPGMAPLLALSKTFQSMIAPWQFMMSATYVMLEVLKRLALILQANWVLFVTYGALFYAVPKRLTRVMGGALISVAVAYYLLIPFMPVFVGALAPSTLVEIECTMENQSGYPCNINFQELTPEQLINILGFIQPAAAAYIWSRFFLPFLYLAMISMVAYGIGRVVGGFTDWLMLGFE